MTDTATKSTHTETPDVNEAPLNDRQKAFKRYKDGVKTGGKPFFPYGVYHDVIAAAGVMALIILITVVWFAQANCDSWFNVNCKNAATSVEQHQYTPKTPGASVWIVQDGMKTREVTVKPGDKIPAGAVKPAPDTDKPLLGPLYEEQADPATTQYHPRPEWYFYFLFYLLIVFAHPDLVVLGTIGLPTIWLVLLILWPFLDRKKERRPSRRPVAMTAMVLTAVTLLSFTYLGSQSGKEGGDDFTADQKAMPGYNVLFVQGKVATCKGCHVIGGAGGNVGPVLDEVGLKNYGLDYQIQHLVDPASKMPGSQMPSQRALFNDAELAQVAAFLETLGKPERASDPMYANAGAKDTEKALGGEGSEDESMKQKGEVAESGK